MPYKSRLTLTLTAMLCRGCGLLMLMILMCVVVPQDPTNDLLQIAEVRGMLESRFHALSLGQGQAPFATRMLKEGVREVFEHCVSMIILRNFNSSKQHNNAFQSKP